MELSETKDARAMKGWWIIQCVVGLTLIPLIAHLSLLDGAQEWVQAYNSVVIVFVISIITTICAVTCLQTSDLLFRVSLLVLTWLWQGGCVALGSMVGNYWGIRPYESWNVTLADAAMLCVLLILATIPTILVLLSLRWVLGWRAVGKNDYWRRSGSSSVAGLLGITASVAVALTIYRKVDLTGLPLDPLINQGIQGLMIGVGIVLPLPWLMRKVLRQEANLWLVVLFMIGMVGGFNVGLLRYSSTMNFEDAVLLILLLQFVVYLPTIWGVLWVFRCFNWRLVRGDALTSEEREQRGLSGAWEKAATEPTA